jgi:hypothetical protein
MHAIHMDLDTSLSWYHSRYRRQIFSNAFRQLVGRVLTASAGIEVRDVSASVTHTDLKLEPRFFEYLMTYCDVFSNLWGCDCLIS